ncbi:MAG TPA: hypothetical protein VF482_19190 [Trebonia sp.]
MIRRGFWLAVGVVGGIMGYRRVVTFGRRASGTLGAGRASAKKRRWVRETIRFTRDVQEGMDLYMARHPRQVGPTLGANGVASGGAANDLPEPLGRVPDGKDRRYIGHANNDVDDVKHR